MIYLKLKVIGWPSILTSHMHPMINYIDYEKGLIRHLSVKPIEWNHYCRGRRLIWIECSCSGAPPSLEDSTFVVFLTKGMQDIKEIWTRKNQKTYLREQVSHRIKKLEKWTEKVWAFASLNVHQLQENEIQNWIFFLMVRKWKKSKKIKKIRHFRQFLGIFGNFRQFSTIFEILAKFHEISWV